MTTDNKYKFIVIDDHPFTRDGVINYVKADERFEFIGEFGDARSVINSAIKGRPDLIILDLNMPGMLGERACPLLKQRFPGCKIVAFTQYEGREKDLEKIGFDGYVVKSEKHSLIEALLFVLDGKKYFKSNVKTLNNTAQKLNELDGYLKLRELTPREIEVAGYLIQDFSNKEIGKEMTIAESTVETHRKHIIEKLEVKNKRELKAALKKYLS